MRPVCNGPCQQGRLPCPAPEACEVDKDEPSFYGREHWLDIVQGAVVVVVVAGSALLAGVLVSRWLA